MSIRTVTLLAALAALMSAQTGFALEVDRAVLPRLTVGGRLLATPKYEYQGGFEDRSSSNSSDIDVSDSSILLRFDKRIYSQQGVAGAMLGLRKVGEDSEVDGDVFFHQLNAFFWNRDLQLLLGQTRQRNFLVEFPTLRDEDLLDYVYVPDASSYREAEEDILFAPTASLDWFVDRKRNAVSLWSAAQKRTETTGSTKSASLNSGGIGWRYSVPESLRYVERLQNLGLALSYQRVNRTVKDSSDGFFSVTAGGEMNLGRDPSRVWTAGLQGIYNNGIGNVDFDPAAPESLRLGALRQAESWSTAAYLAYTGRPKLLTRFRAGLMAAYKQYPDNSDAAQFSVIPNLVYRIGHAMDIVAQYRYTHVNDDLAAMTGFDSDHTIQLGLVFGFDQTFNDNIGERTSILNVEHGYIQ